MWSMLFTAVLLQCIVLFSCHLQVNASTKDGKMGRARSLIWKSPSNGNLIDQYLSLKRIYLYASMYNRQLIVAQLRDDINKGAYNLCDVFELPSTIQCVRKASMKCKSTSNNTTTAAITSKVNIEDDYDSILRSKKKAFFYCETSLPLLGAESERMAQIGTIASDVFPLIFRAKSTEAVQYVRTILSSSEHQVAVSWGEGNVRTASCSQSSDGMSAACNELINTAQQLYDTLIKGKYCSSNTGICYLRGMNNLPATITSKLNNIGFKTFPNLWEGDLKGVHVNAVSTELMEYGLMLDANTFLSFSNSISSTTSLEDMVELERFRAKKSYCTSARDGLESDTADSWCSLLKKKGFKFEPQRYALRAVVRNTAEDALKMSVADAAVLVNGGSDGPSAESDSLMGRLKTVTGLLVIRMMSSTYFQLGLGGVLGILLVLLLKCIFLPNKAATDKAN